MPMDPLYILCLWLFLVILSLLDVVWEIVMSLCGVGCSKEVVLLVFVS